MSSSQSQSLYPEVDQSNPESTNPFAQKTSSSLYPTIEMKELAENLFPDTENDVVGSNPDGKISSFESSEELIIKVPGTIIHLIDKDRSIELASGDFSIVCLRQGGNIVAALARVGDDQIQWPLARDEAAIKLDDTHYFFTLRVPNEGNKNEIYSENLLNYGLTIAAKGQEELLKKLDEVLGEYSRFSVEKVEVEEGWLMAAKNVSPEEMEKESETKEMVEKSSQAYWTTLAPNVEDYSGWLARAIAAGSGQMVRGILWCSDVTVDRLKWGDDFLKKRVGKAKSSDVSPEALKRMKRVKKLTQKSEQVATGILAGVVKVSGFFTSSIANSKIGQKFFNLLPGQVILASLDGFNKVWDAVEVAGTNVMSTTAVVTTGLVSQRHGEQAAEVTRDGLDAAGHAIGTAWAVFKIRKALNPKSVIKPTKIAKATAQVALNEKQKNK